MPSERRRHQLYDEMKQALSVDSADELMSYLPPVGWADVATKADISMVRIELDAHRAEMRGEFGRVDGRLDALTARIAGVDAHLGGRLDGIDGRLDRLDARLDGLDARLDGLDGRQQSFDGRLAGFGGRLEGLKGELRAELADAVSSLRVSMVIALAAMSASTAGIVFGALKLAG